MDRVFSKNWKVLLVGCILAIIGIQSYDSSLASKHRVIASDVDHYYSYLPAAFIHNDLTFSFNKRKADGEYIPLALNESKKGIKYPKMTMGVAICYMPFFLAAHGITTAFSLPNDGYSANYHRAVAIASFLFLLLGLHFMVTWLSLFYKTWVVILTTLLVVFATNLDYYAYCEPGMSHVFSFGLIAAWIYFNDRLSINDSHLQWILFGLLSGLIFLIRPVNAIVFLLCIPKLLYWPKQFTKPAVAFVGAILILIPQMLYWKLFHGSWIFDSYGDEGFYFGNSQIINGLFSYRKGWLVYTPAALLMLAGMWTYRRIPSRYRVTIPMAFLLFIYVVFSWWCWWYGGSYGARPMIDIYALLALPMASSLSFILERKQLWPKTILGLFLVCCIALNIHQAEQKKLGILHWDSMTEQAYWAVFLKDYKPDDFEELIQAPDYEAALQGKEEY